MSACISSYLQELRNFKLTNKYFQNHANKIILIYEHFLKLQYNKKLTNYFIY